MQRHFEIVSANHDEDSSVRLQLQENGEILSGRFDQYPPEKSIRTNRMGQTSLIMPNVELVLIDDNSQYVGTGYTVETNNKITGGSLVVDKVILATPSQP